MEPSADQSKPDDMPKQHVDSPAPTIAAPTAAEPTAPAAETHATTIVLQWLTYAFWGWTVLGTSALVGTVFANLISKADTGDFMPYGIAAVLVLLPISVACDFFYTKQEPVKKTGAASIVMVIHAVLFALFGIGALITAVFSLIFMFTSSNDASASQTILCSALVIFVIYGATFLRTINPPRIPKIRRFYTIFMVAVIGIIAFLGIIGPFANARVTRNDRFIESSLGGIETAIDTYAETNEKLPSNLGNLSLQGDSQKLSSQVDYNANTLPSVKKITNLTTLSSSTAYYYQLCVDFKQASNNYNKYSPGADIDSDGYEEYLSAYSHPTGHVCYKLKKITYDYNN